MVDQQLTADELAKERDKITRMAKIIGMWHQTQGVEGLTLEFGKDTEEEYFVRFRQHDLTGTYYGEMNTITKEEAQEARRLQLTPWSIDGIDNDR